MSTYTVFHNGSELFEANSESEIESEIVAALENGDIEVSDVEDLEIRKNVSFSSDVEVKYEVNINLDD